MNRTRRITETAMLIALAFVLELVSKMVPLLQMPQGGSISLAMLPILILSFHLGWKWGILGGVTYGVLNFLVDASGAIHWGSFFFDYIFAFGILGIAGFFARPVLKGKIAYFVVGIILGGFGRYVFHGLSGVIFFAKYAGEEGAFVYSFLIYNLPYMSASIALCIAVGLLLYRPLIAMFKNKRYA